MLCSVHVHSFAELMSTGNMALHCTTVCSNQIPHFSKTNYINKWTTEVQWININEGLHTRQISPVGKFLETGDENHWITVKRIWTLMWGLGCPIDMGSMLTAKNRPTLIYDTC